MFLSKVSLATSSAVALLVVLAFCGCSDSDDPVDIVAPPTPIQCPTVDSLMETFEASYTTMALSVFEDILHDDFKMIFTDNAINDWNLDSGATLDKAQMLAIHNNMFSGNPGSGPDGNFILPLAAIQINVFDRMTPWAVPEVEDPDFPGMLKALYEVKMYFPDTSGTHAFYIDHDLAFYTAQVGGFWYLTGLKPLISWGDKTTENTSYDNVIYMFREISEKPRD